MNLNDILMNEETNKFYEKCVKQTYNRFKLMKIMDFDDFYQDASIHVFKNIERLDETKSSLNTYLPLLIMTCAKHKIAHAHGGSKKVDKMDFESNICSLDITVGLDGAEDKMVNVISDKNYDLESEILSNCMIDEIFKSNFLTEKEKEVLKLTMEGYTQREIAETMDCWFSNVGGIYRNAKKKIRRLIVSKYA